jgi:hypothetical protein
MKRYSGLKMVYQLLLGYFALVLKLLTRISGNSYTLYSVTGVQKGLLPIFPSKNEIWAALTNWKITLSSTDIDKCEPRIAEILSDYSG